MSEAREQRNEVFKGSSNNSGVDPRIPQQSLASQVKSDFGLEIPVDLAPLPSTGKTYSTESPLNGQDSLEIRAMTAREEDILTSKAFLKKGTMITELIKSCLVNKAIDPREMLIGDRNALMVAIRATGYGSDYDAELECNECGMKAPRQFDLAALPIKRLDIDPVVPNSNLFEFVLPVCKRTVRFRFLTGRDEEDIMVAGEKQKKLGFVAESSVTTSLLYSIVSIDGIDDRSKIAGFVKSMPARDSLMLRSYISDHEPGIIMRQETTCPACGHTEEVSMPLGVSFFWPKAGR